MSFPAKECFGIFMLAEDGSGHEELDGFIIYGLGARGTLGREMPAEVLESLPAWMGRHRTATSLLIGERWEVAMWWISMVRWPTNDEWQPVLTGLFEAMIAQGAKVAWIGDETMSYADPPWLFLPEHMRGGVPAWRTADGRQGGNLDPDQPLRPATDDELRALRAYAKGLADVS